MVHCHAGRDPAEVTAALELYWAELRSPPHDGHRGPADGAEAVYDYPAGSLPTVLSR